MTKGWKTAPFEEVFADVSAGQPKTMARDFQSSGQFPLIDQGKDLVGGYTDDETRLSTAELPLIVFGDHTRAVKYVDFKFGVGADGVKLLRPRADAHVRYLFHFLEAARIPAAGYDRHFKYLKRLTVPLPPIEEQRRIAAVLDQADEVAVKRRVSVSRLDAFSVSTFRWIFGDLASNSMNWPVLPFSQLCPTRLGKMLDQKQQTGLHRRPYLRNVNVQWFRVELDDLADMDFSEKDRAEFLLQSGDVLICEGGEPGRAAVWRGELNEVYFQKALHRGRPHPDLATPDYVVYLLRELAVSGGLADHISSATIAHLTGERLKAMLVPAPPVDLQRAFTSRLVQIGACRDRILEHARTVDQLLASLQSRAFSGGL